MEAVLHNVVDNVSLKQLASANELFKLNAEWNQKMKAMADRLDHLSDVCLKMAQKSKPVADYTTCTSSNFLFSISKLQNFQIVILNPLYTFKISRLVSESTTGIELFYLELIAARDDRCVSFIE